MVQDTRKTDTSSRSAGLLLRVHHPDGRLEEFYLAQNLSIGRAANNTIVLSDGEGVARTHAKVEFRPDGSAELVCGGQEDLICVGEKMVRKLALAAGTRFEIGRSRFECVPGQGLPNAGVSTACVCPDCGSPLDNVGDPRPVKCTSCFRSLLVVAVKDGGPAIAVPVNLDEYRVDTFVAHGGMGFVFKGAEKRAAKPVAIKVLPPDGSGGPETARFEREIAMMSRVRHPNVVSLLGHGSVGPLHYLVTDWVEGGSLRDLISQSRQDGRFAIFESARRTLLEVCKGLAAIHAAGIVHRDIKPSNILVAADGSALVSDLGIARPACQDQTALTTTGQLPGTYAYMAPEQFAGPDAVDQRADLYSLGVTFYEFLTGELPRGAYRPASALNPSVPAFFDQILERLLAPNRDDRYANIDDLLTALNQAEAAWPSEVHCPKCGNRIARSATKCPSCAAVTVLEAGRAQTITSVLETLAAGESFTRIMMLTLRCVHGARRLDPRLKVAVIVLTAACLFCMQPGAADKAFQLGKDAYDKRDWDSAVSAFSEVVRLHPNSAEAYRYRGDAYRKKGNLAKATEDYTQAIGIEPAYVSAYLNRGLVRFYGSNFDKAIADYTEAIRLTPDFEHASIAYYNRGCAYGAIGDRVKAIADYTEAIRLTPDFGQAYVNRGMNYSAKGDLTNAIDDYSRAIQVDPNYAMAYYLRGAVYYRKGEKARAKDDWQRAMGLGVTVHAPGHFWG